MNLVDELARAADAALPHAGVGETLAAVIPAEPAEGLRVYLCAFESTVGRRSWLGLDPGGQTVSDRRVVREAASIAALCELAEELAGGGELDVLATRLDELAEREGVGVSAARRALAGLRSVIEAPPRLASPAYLDRIGAATRTLEQELGEVVGSPFANAMKQASASVEGVAAEVEAGYKVALS